jgi:hypothetical protein
VSITKFAIGSPIDRGVNGLIANLGHGLVRRVVVLIARFAICTMLVRAVIRPIANLVRRDIGLVARFAGLMRSVSRLSATFGLVSGFSLGQMLASSWDPNSRSTFSRFASLEPTTLFSLSIAREDEVVEMTGAVAEVVEFVTGAVVEFVEFVEFVPPPLIIMSSFESPKCVDAKGANNGNTRELSPFSAIWKPGNRSS